MDWTDSSEANQALELIEMWTPIDIADALELLSFLYSNPGLRSYGVKQLSRADDDEFQYFLLQLVQALKFEKSYPSPLSNYLIKRCCLSFKLANYLNWYVSVETEDSEMGQTYSTFRNEFLAELNKVYIG